MSDKGKEIKVSVFVLVCEGIPSPSGIEHSLPATAPFAVIYIYVYSRSSDTFISLLLPSGVSYFVLVPGIHLRS